MFSFLAVVPANGHADQHYLSGADQGRKVVKLWCGNLTLFQQNDNDFQRRIQSIKYPQSYVHPVSYEVKKIIDNEITHTKNHKLWGTMPSIGISLGAFLVMNFVTAGIVALMFFFSFNLEALLDFIANPNFLIFSSFLELIFILFPVLYVGKYLENPSLKNRFGLLGFTLKGLTKKGLCAS